MMLNNSLSKTINTIRTVALAPKEQKGETLYPHLLLLDNKYMIISKWSSHSK